jgi:hypothetical protein
MAFRFGFVAMRFVWAVWLAPYRIAMVTGIGLLLIAIGFTWRWLQIPPKQFFGVDIDDHLFFASAVLVFALMVAIIVPALIFMAIGAVWKAVLEKIDKRVAEIRGILRAVHQGGSGLVYLATNYRGVVIETSDAEMLRRQLARTGIDLAERSMLTELRRLGSQVLHEVEMVNFRFRHLKLGHMERVIYDPKYGGGFLYFHVHANQYLFGCVVDVEPLEPKNGQLPPAYKGMEETAKAIRAALGLAMIEEPVKAPAANLPA